VCGCTVASQAIQRALQHNTTQSITNSELAPPSPPRHTSPGFVTTLCLLTYPTQPLCRHSFHSAGVWLYSRKPVDPATQPPQQPPSIHTAFHLLAGCIPSVHNPTLYVTLATASPPPSSHAGVWLYSRKPIDPESTATMRRVAESLGLDVSNLKPVTQVRLVLKIPPFIDEACFNGYGNTPCQDT
jgi:hypothetical protein